MKTSLVSVVIPSFNHDQYIRSAVESVLAQSYGNIELIVIDDGSTDRSLDYLASVDDPRYRFLSQNNAGAHSAINRGLELAEGDYLAILNSDDMFHPERVALCVERLERGADLVASWIEVINKKGKTLGVKQGWSNMLPWKIGGPLDDCSDLDQFSRNLLASNFVATTSNVAFTRDLYERIGGMRNLRFAHDWDFLLRAARYCKCDLVEQPLLKYRTHESNTISSDRAWMLFEICWIYAVHLKFFMKHMGNKGDGIGALSEKIDFLSKAVNLQGNDKVLWLLLLAFYECERKGIASPEEVILDDDHLRSEFIRHIDVSGA